MISNSYILQIRKLVRFISIYGFSRAFVKVLGRLRPNIKVALFLRLLPFRSGTGHVGIIGAGQHAFSSIAFFISRFTKGKISFVYDTNKKMSDSLAYAYGADSLQEIPFSITEIKKKYDIVYIASNHASHAFYALKLIELGESDVFIEKPLALDMRQLSMLSEAMRGFTKRVFAGYNRPFSPAIKKIRSHIKPVGPISLSCSVIWHFIPSDHWYRKSEEGSRVVANLGHWIDLAVNLLSARSFFPNHIDISYLPSDATQPSDNVSISLSSDRGDLVNIFFTSRSEPFEGVNETILFQQSDLIAKIDDFRRMSLWRGDRLSNYSYRPKDNGHKECVLQPFRKGVSRTWTELERSTRLMLHIEQMVMEQTFKLRVHF